VLDATGAGVPGATLAVTNQATKASEDVTSSADGSYSAHLAPGVYSVTAFVKGFAKSTHKDLKVDAGATATANFTLEAHLAEEIAVTAMKREETVFSTPVSVAAPRAVLRSRGVEDIEGWRRTSPG
jgi:hypothetical protein